MTSSSSIELVSSLYFWDLSSTMASLKYVESWWAKIRIRGLTFIHHWFTGSRCLHRLIVKTKQNHLRFEKRIDLFTQSQFLLSAQRQGWSWSVCSSSQSLPHFRTHLRLLSRSSEWGSQALSLPVSGLDFLEYSALFRTHFELMRSLVGSLDLDSSGCQLSCF